MPRIKTNDDIPDIQCMTEGFPKKYIPKVGSHNIRIPLEIIRKDGSINPTKGLISVYTDLNAETKGANMSRFRIMIEEEVANKTHNVVELIDTLLDDCKERCKSNNAYIKVKFDYFLMRTAPASKIKSHMDYEGWFEGRLENGVKRFFMHARVLYCSLCCCSKEISDYGAHNQQSYGDVTVELTDIKNKENYFWFEDLVDAIEASASAPMINALKRIDEAYMTELAYENAKFIEDISRQIAERLDLELDKKIKDYVIVLEHLESIHSSSVIAVLHANRELK